MQKDAPDVVVLKIITAYVNLKNEIMETSEIIFDDRTELYSLIIYSKEKITINLIKKLLDN